MAASQCIEYHAARVGGEFGESRVAGRLIRRAQASQDAFAVLEHVGDREGIWTGWAGRTSLRGWSRGSCEVFNVDLAVSARLPWTPDALCSEARLYVSGQGWSFSVACKRVCTAGNALGACFSTSTDCSLETLVQSVYVVDQSADFIRIDTGVVVIVASIGRGDVLSGARTKRLGKRAERRDETVSASPEGVDCGIERLDFRTPRRVAIGADRRLESGGVEVVRGIFRVGENWGCGLRDVYDIIQSNGA